MRRSFKVEKNFDACFSSVKLAPSRGQTIAEGAQIIKQGVITDLGRPIIVVR